jgi:Ribbon-helix-helix protein, copG family
MPKISTKPIDAERIAEMADKGQDISAHFTKSFMVVRPPVQRVNVDFTSPMLKELDREAETLNISRQAVIKTMLREALDRRYLAQQGRRAH